MVTTPIAKLAPPAAPAHLVERPQLLGRLDDALNATLTTVIAGAGFGKTVALGSWAEAHSASWLTLTGGDGALVTMMTGITESLRVQLPEIDPGALGIAEHIVGPGGDDAERAESYAARLSDAIAGTVDRPVVLVLDGIDEVDPRAPGAQLIDALVRTAPPQLHLVLASRTTLPWPVDRLRGRGQLLEVGADALRFEPAETHRLLSAVLGAVPSPLAEEVHAVTGGWPAATHLTAQALRDVASDQRAAVVGRLHGAGAGLMSFLAGEVLAAQPAPARALLRAVAPLPCFDASLCATLGIDEAEATIDGLARDGLVRTELGVDDEVAVLTTLVRDGVERIDPQSDDERATTVRAGARWLAERQRFEQAVTLLVDGGDTAELAALLDEASPVLLAQGHLVTLCRAAELVPPALRTPATEEVIGQALMVTGDWEASLTCMERATSGRDEQPVSVAWRLGLLHHLRGELDQALAAYDSAEISPTDDPMQVSVLHSMRASLLWVRGDIDSSRKGASQAMELARDCNDPNALSAAHTALAMLAKSDGDRRASDAHDRLALDFAEEAGNVLQVIRIRSNRGSHLVEVGAYALAVAELEVAIELAELTGFSTFLAMARSNRGEAWRWLGRLDEAEVDHQTAAAIYDRLGSGLVVYPLLGLADIHRIRGEVTLAAATYERIIAAAQRTGDAQVLVPAKAGLARVLVTTDPERADQLAAEVVTEAGGATSVVAQLGAGWVALHLGQPERAAELATTAAGLARARRDQAGAAEAGELAALCEPDPADCHAGLRRAIDAWDDIGAPISSTCAALALARLEGDEETAEDLRGRLAVHGIREGATQVAASLGAVATGAVPSAPRSVAARRSAPLRIDVLGGFRVRIDGREVPTSAWQSRKARDLVKVLLVRRGQPVPRDVLTDLLWADQPPDRAASGLSVAMSVARGVLDPDRAHPPDRYIAATPEAVRLDLNHVATDAEEFLALAERALRAGDEDASATLTAAEAAYGGELLADDPYEDWAVTLREECRAAYLAVLRRLVATAGAAGDVDGVTRYGLRLLADDPYDEACHLNLVATLSRARRHGEAQRHYRTYTARMRELDIEPAPFPSATAGR